MSLVPRTGLLKPFSWKAAAQLSRRHFAQDDKPLVGELSGGIGVGYEPLANTLGYFFAEAALPISDRFDRGVVFGIGPRLGLLRDLSARWRAELVGHSQWYVAENRRSSYELALNQRVALTSQSAIRLTIARKREFGSDFVQGEFSVHLYF